MRHTVVAMMIAGVLLVSGCGGGGGAATGGGPAPAPNTVSGVAAAGLVIVGNVYLKDSAAAPRELSKATANGNFSFDVTGMTKPFMLKAVGTANGTPYTLYSLAVDKGTANINPMANLVLANAASGADLAGVHAAPAASGIQGIAGRLGRALLEVQSTLKPMLQKYGVAAVDPIRDAYKADGTGLDGMLDLVKIELGNSGTVAISDAGASPVTRNLATDFATRAVYGTATLGGAPFAGVTVTVADAATGTVVYGSATTAADGSYLVDNVAQGSFTVTAAKAGYSFDGAKATVAVSSADCRVPAFRSFQPFTVSGTVAGANGPGLAGVIVLVQRVGAVGAAGAVTDGKGRYSVGGLTNGSYTVTPSRPYDSAAVSFAGGQSITIGDTANFAVADFTASVPSFTVFGNVSKLAGGEGMAGVAIKLVTKNAFGALSTDGAATFGTVTDAAGNYTLSGIPGGYYALTPSLTGYGFALLDTFAVNGTTADNFGVNGADTRLDFSGRPTSDASGGIGGY